MPVNIYASAGFLLASENESIEIYKCNHEDINRNHYCDYCTLRISDHEDVDKNHYCDYCSTQLSSHEDSNSNGYCDYCSIIMDSQMYCQHQDIDYDHYCDYCNQMISIHKATLVQGAAATYHAAGYCDYYECGCGSYFEDSECTTEILDVKKWKSEGGIGYLPMLQEMTKNDIVENGDDTDILFLSIIMLISAVCCGICIIYRHYIGKKN